MTNQGNVARRTVPVMLLRAAGAVAVLGCLAAIVGMLVMVTALVNIGIGLLVVAVVIAAASLVVRIAR